MDGLSGGLINGRIDLSIDLIRTSLGRQVVNRTNSCSCLPRTVHVSCLIKIQVIQQPIFVQVLLPRFNNGAGEKAHLSDMNKVFLINRKTVRSFQDKEKWLLSGPIARRCRTAAQTTIPRSDQPFRPFQAQRTRPQATQTLMAMAQKVGA